MATTRKHAPAQAPDSQRAAEHASALAAIAARDLTALVPELKELEGREPALAVAAVAALARVREPAAAQALSAIAEGPVTRELRKEARRGLHRLRATGLDVPQRVQVSSLAPPTRPRGVLYEAWASVPDGVGSRLVWMLADRPLGGIWAVGLMLNDVVGMKAAQFRETTRKRFHARLQQWLDDEAGWVQLPVDYATQLVGEALALNQRSQVPVPREFQVNRDQVEAIERSFEAALVYREISPGAARLAPDWLSDSDDLLDEPELERWVFGLESVLPFATELRDARGGELVATPGASPERYEQIVSQAIQVVVTPELRQCLKRRLEETAYVLLRTERPQEARLAVAAAVGIEQASSSSLLLPQSGQRLDQHPFLRAMMERSLELAQHATEPGHEAEAAIMRRSPYDPIQSD